MSPETVPLTEIAKRLGRTVTTIQAGLKQGRLPFGTAFPADGGKWCYIVPRAAFELFMNTGMQSQITQVVVNREDLPNLAKVIIQG